MSYLSIISLQGLDRVGILLDLVGVITGELNINIRELKIQSHDGIFEGEVSLYVTSTDDLNAVIGKIKKIKGVDKAQRIVGTVTAGGNVHGSDFAVQKSSR